MQLVGYKLIDARTLDIVDQWGGVAGQCPGIPTSIRLPSGDDVCAPHLDTEYNGYVLVAWEIVDPDPAAPLTI